MSTADALDHWQRRRLPSPMFMLCLLATLSLYFCVAVYIVPQLSGQSIDGAYDAFSYAASMTEDPALARDLQPFLHLYPSWSRTALFFYALLLHALLLVPSLIVLRRFWGRGGLAIVLAAIAVPESAMYLGSVSKEGLGIVAIVAALAGQSLVVRGNAWRGALMCVYAVAIAEVSRPLYGFPFGAALLIGFLPALRPVARRLTYAFLAVGFVFGTWVILYGPFASEFTDIYQSAKQFLDWFEKEMGSDSPVKSATRQFFASAFGGDRPSPAVLVLICLAAIGKAIVYVLAIPLIAPANFTDMPAQAWALTWQVAASMSSVAMVTGLFMLRKHELDTESKCRLWFGLALMLVISISTAIFHVRYRAPAVVVLLAAVWLVSPAHRRWLVWMTLPTLFATAIALISTA